LLPLPVSVPFKEDDHNFIAAACVLAQVALRITRISVLKSSAPPFFLASSTLTRWFAAHGDYISLHQSAVGLSHQVCNTLLFGA
jgi:hypothetical protein